jgi:NADH-quinone oxidoreductase subunit G
MSDAVTTDAEGVPEPVPDDAVAIEINGKELLARKGELLIAAAERHGVYIPHFCYHPRMQPVGMCRMCIAEVDTGRGPSLQPTCMLEVVEGMKLDTESDVTKKAQDGILEFLLINHPLDCPVCDKGGECPLQDQTMAYGPGESRFVEEKRHHEKPIPISGLVLLDRERCILCDRCTRFASDVAGDPLIHFVNRGGETEVNTFPDHEFASYFSGNTVQICPVGALTSTSYRFKARPWDLEESESTCQTCSVGCRMAVQSSRDEVVRFTGIDLDPVNWGWMCDRGRFNHQYVGHEDRLTEPLVREGDELVPARWGSALRRTADAVRAASEADPGRVAVIGGAHLTNESAYAWAKLAKGFLGTDHVDAQLGDGLPAEVLLGLPRATIDDACRAGGTVVLLAPDLKEELPVLHLRLRDAVLAAGVQVVEIRSLPSSFAPLAEVFVPVRPGAQGELVKGLLGGVADPNLTATPADAFDRARAVIDQADGPLTVILGRQSLAESPDGLVDAAAAFLAARPDTRFLSALRRGNVHGALDMGLAPGLLPGRTALEDGRSRFAGSWPNLPVAPGLDTTGILEAAAAGEIDVLVLLGADPIDDFPDHDLALRALHKAGTVIAVDLFLSASSWRADVVLPAAGFAEVSGTGTNLEGRVTLLDQRVTAPGTARPDWIIAVELAHQLGHDLGLESPSDIAEEIARLAPAYCGVTPDLLRTPGAAAGVVVPLPGADATDDQDAGAGPEGDADVADPGADDQDPGADAAEPDATQPDATGPDGGDPGDEPAPAALVRFEGRQPGGAPAVDSYSLRLIATRRLYDAAVLTSKAPAIAGLAPGTRLRVCTYDFDRLGVAAGADVRVSSPRGSLSVQIAIDDQVPRGCAALEINQPPVRATELIDATQRVTDLRVETA